ncbi:MAG TPA: aldehyde dehydrogenase family protein [Roseiflexaceae bacterium]|nr:aldehyde dehydrogenase family protein [Roseiflexaceae bacterium]
MSQLMLINGERIGSATGETFEVCDPATEEIVGHAPLANEEDARRAIAAAGEAFKSWRKTTAHDKAALLHEVARQIRERTEELATLMTREGGKPLLENRDELSWSAACFDYYAELQRNTRGRVIPSVESSQLAMVLKEPYGVVAAIVPWNYPVLLMSWKVAPALAAGNTVVIKPSEMTPLTTLLFAELFAHLPPGVVNIVSGYGATVGRELVVSAGTQMVAFTGSFATGREIARLAAERVKRTHLELGGKDAFIVAEDADLEVAVPGVAWAALLNAGQVCTSTERVYVHESIAGRFTDRLVDYVRTLRLGHGLEPSTDIGPLIGDRYRHKVELQVDEARQRGARILTGGRRPPGFARGFFYEPTVLTGVDHSFAIMRDETFGPTIPVMTYRSFDEAIALANDSDYGLGANLFTSDPRKVKQYYEEVKAGTCWVNDPLTDNDAGPFGGMKFSGGSRELGEEGLEAFLETKHVHWDFNQERKPWWYPYGQE